MAGNDLIWMKDFLQDELYLLDADKTIAKTIDLPHTAQATQETVAVAFNCLGRTDSEFLVLVSYADCQHIDPAHLQSLTGILGRKGINTDDVTLINLARQADKTYQGIIKYFSPKRLLIMGAEALPSGLNAPQLNTIVNEEPKLLYALSFAEMDDNDKKRAFWEEMKNF